LDQGEHLRHLAAHLRFRHQHEQLHVLAGKTYRLERSNTLQNNSWVPVLENISGTGGVIQITDPVDPLQPRRFYRIVVAP
jgi:hypothetical protein